MKNYEAPRAAVLPERRSRDRTRFETALAGIVFLVSAGPVVLLIIYLIAEQKTLTPAALLAWMVTPVIGVAIGFVLLARTELGLWLGAGWFLLRAVRWHPHSRLSEGAVEPWNLLLLPVNGGILVVNWVWALLVPMFAIACVLRWRARGSTEP